MYVFPFLFTFKSNTRYILISLSWFVICNKFHARNFTTSMIDGRIYLHCGFPWILKFYAQQDLHNWKRISRSVGMMIDLEYQKSFWKLSIEYCILKKNGQVWKFGIKSAEEKANHFKELGWETKLNKII